MFKLGTTSSNGISSAGVPVSLAVLLLLPHDQEDLRALLITIKKGIITIIMS